ncbi:MAG: hypothetical protein IH586_05390 [Anaerolineaceae bacterium]|nr:hypothetical protein [Anaerolineaceae bacterium]
MVRLSEIWANVVFDHPAYQALLPMAQEQRCQHEDFGRINRNFLRASGHLFSPPMIMLRS